MDSAKVTKEQWERNECFHTFCKIFENFILCITEHLFSFTLKLLSVDVFRFCSIKTSRTFKNQNQLTNKEASSVLCFVVKHAGSSRARKKCRGKHEMQSSVFPHFLSALPLPKCFTTEQSTVEASLFVL